MDKNIKKLLISLAIFALGSGIFYNFQELWMLENNLSIKSIGLVYSICALLSVSVIFLASNLIKRNNLKKVMEYLITLDAIVMFILFLLNGSGLNVLIKFLIMIDYVVHVVIITSFYPLISYIKKSDKIFAIKELAYSWGYYIGIFLTTILLSKVFFKITISYNSFCLLSFLLVITSLFILKKVKINEEDEDDSNILSLVFLKVKRDKISVLYLAYLFFNELSYSCVTILTITFLTQQMNYSSITASNINLILLFLSAVIGSIILAKFTLKNDYINFSIKYISRTLVYLLAFLINSKFILLLALVLALILTDSYNNVTEAPYINRFSKKEQFAFNTLRQMVDYAAISVGTFLCSNVILYGYRYNFLVGFIALLIADIFGIYAIKVKEASKR